MTGAEYFERHKRKFAHKTERRVEPYCRGGGILITQACEHTTTRNGSFADPVRAAELLAIARGRCPACTSKHAFHSFPR